MTSSKYNEYWRDNDVQNNGIVEIISNKEDHSDITIKLKKVFGAPLNSTIKWLPDNIINLNKEESNITLKFLDELNNIKDVQSIISNCSFTTN